MCKVKELIPIGVIKKIEGSCRSYLWSGQESSKKARIAWQNVCQEYSRGGLQIKEVLGWNKAVLGAAVVAFSRMQERDTIWRMWVQQYKLNQSSIWEVVPRVTDSPWWKMLLQIRDEIKTKIGRYETHFDGKTSSEVLQELYKVNVPDRPLVAWRALIWNKLVPPRVSFICWMLIQKISTG